MFDNEKKTNLKPGDKGYEGGIFSTRAYAPGKNVEVTTKKGPNGEVEAVFIRDLFLGIF